MPVLVKDQSRLIDHFKRVYSLIVGLSLTEACKALFPIDAHAFAVSSLWMFLALFITVIPIFQGGDRYLDVAHMSQSLSPVRARASFMWDVYMLLLTALILVGVARSIPPASPSASVGTVGVAASAAIETVTAPPPSHHLDFFYGLAILFFFDVFVLIVGYVKARQRGEIDRNYRTWIASNTIMGSLCSAAALTNDHFFCLQVGTSTLAFIILVCAAIRTLVDYRIDNGFMFPDVISAQIDPTTAAPPSSS